MVEVLQVVMFSSALPHNCLKKLVLLVRNYDHVSPFKHNTHAQFGGNRVIGKCLKDGNI